MLHSHLYSCALYKICFRTNFQHFENIRHIHLCHKPSNKLRYNLCNFKDRREPSNQAGVVYKLCCNDCSAVYIGDTGRLLNERIEEHRKDVAKSNATANVYLHVQSTGHTFDFSNVNVIAQSSNVKLRRRLEGIHTFKTDNTINRACDTTHFILLH